MSTHSPNKFTYIICGLGNPGNRYLNTRHNVGQMFINYMNKKHKLEIITKSNYSYSIYTCNNQYKPKKDPNNKVLFLIVNEYMNTSGSLIKTICLNDFKHELNQVKIICDDLETEIGKIKNSFEGGDRGHNGLKGVINSFGNNNFEKIKIGIGRPESKNPLIVSNYVLSRFERKEIEILEELSFRKIEDYINRKC